MDVLALNEFRFDEPLEITVNSNGQKCALAPLETHIVQSRMQLQAHKYKMEREQARERAREFRYKAITRAKEGAGDWWIACYHEPMKEIVHNLKLSDSGALFRVLLHMQPNKDGLLIKDGIPMTIADISRIIKKSESQTKRIVGRLANKDVGVIIKDTSARKKPTYSINGQYHTMGCMKKGMMFTKLYLVKNRSRLENLKNEDIGLLYKILPWFHRYNYYLCTNSDERDPNIVHFLTQGELAELIGEDVRTVRDGMKRLEHAGVIMIHKGHRVVSYIVHPDVMFGQDILQMSKKEREYADAVRYQFEQHRLQAN